MGWLVQWVVRPIFGMLIGQVAIHAIHFLGFYPEIWLAGRVAGMAANPSPDLVSFAQWFLAALIALLVLLGYDLYQRRMRPSAKKIQQAPPRQTEAISELDRIPEEYSVEELFSYLLSPASDWGRNNRRRFALPEQQAWRLIHDALQEGVLQSSGRRRFQHEYEQIPARHWLTSAISVESLMRGAGRSQRTDQSVPAPEYEGIRINRKEAEVCFPKTQIGPGEPDYSAWDQVQNLTTFQASRLWAGQEPTADKSTDTAYAWFRAIKEAIQRTELRQEVPGAINRNSLVSRAELRRFALSRGERPKFLFPEER